MIIKSMNAVQIMSYATRHKSKLQQSTHFLTKEELDTLLEEVIKPISLFPEAADCNKTTPSTIRMSIIDAPMRNMTKILSGASGTPNDPNIYNVFIVLNFTWKHKSKISVGVLHMLVSYQHGEEKPTENYIVKCVATTKETLALDHLLPEQNLLPVRTYVFSQDVMSTDLESLFEKIPLLFVRYLRTPDKIEEVASMLHRKKSDTRLYFNLRVFTNTDDPTRPYVVRISIANNSRTQNHEIVIEREKERFLDNVIKQLVKNNKDAIKRLRSYASKNNLPFYEKTYHVSMEAIQSFYDMLDSTVWFNVGMFIYKLKNKWDELPPYSGIIESHIAICMEENILHMAFFIPYTNTVIETSLIVLHKEAALGLFPKKQDIPRIRRYALKPSTSTLPPEDSFLEPYIHNSRYSTIIENVRAPTNKTLPGQLEDEIKKWRQSYKKKLIQHFQKRPDDLPRFKLHPSYVEEVGTALKEKQKQKAIQQYVYQKPLEQIPTGNVFRQSLLRKRQQVRQELAMYDSPEDLVEKIWTDLNLIDPIQYQAIHNPVRSPYNPAGIYQKKSLQDWLSKHSTRLDPMSRKEMPTTFVPMVDQKLHRFVSGLHDKIQKIMTDQTTDDLIKKINLWKLHLDHEKHKVFQTIIRKKQKQQQKT